jgi:hypothetical protein
MLTLFTIPKAFIGETGIMQTNAIRSWTLLRPACEIILFGKDEGTAEIAAQFGVRHVPDIAFSQYGTPLLNSVFRRAHDIASHQLMCFINTDIILMSDFLPAIKMVKEKRFFIVGLRWDLDMNEAINFEDTRWESVLRTRLAEHGKPHPPGGGGDFFIYPRGLFKDIPPFIIGRGGWDNWLIYRARAIGVPVIDATRAFINVHQNHGYSHIEKGIGEVWKGPESRENVKLMGDRALTTEYATHLLTAQGVKLALSPRHIYLRLRTLPMLHPRVHFLLALFRAFEKTVEILRGIRASPVKPAGGR